MSEKVPQNEAEIREQYNMKPHACYVVLGWNGTDGLSQQVSTMILAGWDCQGGVCMVVRPPNEDGSYAFWYSQAMVRE